MPRDGAHVRRRLQEAALELYSTNGFDRTTTAEIAAQAGVTERTFFRHFADKREVFFEGEADLIATLVEGVHRAPGGGSPMKVLLHAFCSVAPLVEANRPFLEPRQKVIEATPALQERALAKSAAVTTALSAALADRGIELPIAMLAAQTGIAAFGFAVRMWHMDSASGLADHLERAFARLHELTQSTRVAGRR